MEPIALKHLSDRVGKPQVCELIGIAITTLNSYLNGGFQCPTAVEKAARHELSKIDKSATAVRHAVVAVQGDQAKVFETLMRGSGIDFMYLPGGK